MLQVKQISKRYITGDLTQSALDGVSLNLRDSEFVAILGPSGSGKTTLLNIIGGLDRYDSGDLIINSVSTKRYKDRDWDSYRNHTIGFVFQSYNLIPHQSVLANVELALTISGIPKAERRRRAKEALIQVGLADHIHKRPNQMSGGQMQRVAIARALVNNPDILLADEPTGALDTETSVQVMALLKEVAKDRLVIMVTHNPELAEEYANRTVRLRDGKVVDDSNPFEVDESALAPPTHKNLGKASMSFGTALSLSFNNLRTKKARTILTAFAGSIGIIGIALILSISTGVNDYITNIQKDTMSSYPITIDAMAMDFSSMMSSMGDADPRDFDHDLDAIYANAHGLEMASRATSSITENNLTAFKRYLDNPDSEIHQYTGDNGIVYSYDVRFDAYAYDPENKLVNTDGSEFTVNGYSMSGSGGMSASGMEGMSSMNSLGGLIPSSANLQELLPSADGLVAGAVQDNYDLLYGAWPANHDEVIIVLNERNEVSIDVLYALGLLPSDEYKDALQKIAAGEEVKFPEYKWSYEEFCQQSFRLIPECDYYVKNESGLYVNVSDDAAEMQKLLDNALKLRIVGVVRPMEDANYTPVSSCIGYTQALTSHIIGHAAGSAVVKAQEASPGMNVVNGMAFMPQDDAAKIADAIDYINSLGVSEKAKLYKSIMQGMQSMGGMGGDMDALLAMGEVDLAAMLDEFLQNPQDSVLLALYNSTISPGSYDDNMTAFGLVSLDAPQSISIYADSFEDKDAISESITRYNDSVEDADRIVYTDFVGLLMSSVVIIVNVISYVLIAFVAISLVVSSIMIGIITFISVLERTKEIGILRAVGASKGNVSQVFNAETFIIGLLSGLIGVGVTLLLLIPGNAIIHAVTGTTMVNAALPVTGAVVLVILSMCLTLIAGLIPSSKAANKDPVIALRTE